MSTKGIKHTAEAKARISEAAKRVWAERKAAAELNAIDCAAPRCRDDLPDALIYRGKIYPSKVMMLADASADTLSYIDFVSNIGEYRPAKKTLWQTFKQLLGGK